MKTVYPPALHKGDTIGVMAPASRVERKIVMQGVRLLESWGYGVYVHPQTWKRHGQSAGRASDKARALHDLYRDKSIRAIICARGGNRTGWMLEELDYRLIKRYPKIVMGYSDVTALLCAIRRETGQAVFHGPVLHDFGRGRVHARQMRECLRLLGGAEKTVIPMGRARTIRPGSAAGELVGGNLSLICSLMGTPWQPDFKGKILFLEDVDEEISRYDRMFVQLHNAGIFRQIAGLVLGAFTDTKDTGFIPFGFSLEDIVRQQTANLKIPVVMGAPFGHLSNMYTFPMGSPVRLAAGRGKVSLVLDGPAVSL